MSRLVLTDRRARNAGLLTCARCGCSITAERKKGRYTYYRCTGFHGSCGNAYIREERLSLLLGDVVQRVQIPAEIAEWISERLRDDDQMAEQARQKATAQLTKRRNEIRTKLDRGYEDYLDAKISEAFWSRKSGEWESELVTIEADLGRQAQPISASQMKGEKILELAKQAGFLYKSQSTAEQRRLLDTVLSNCTYDRGTLCPTYNMPFDLLSQGNETGRMAGPTGLEPATSGVTGRSGAKKKLDLVGFIK